MSEQTKPLICIVDDDPVLAAMLSIFLQQHGYETRVFGSADDLLHGKGVPERTDLIISDINMPGQSGYDLCRAVRALERPLRIPIILLTGGEIGEKAKGLEAGADDFIHKPCRNAELRAKINSLLAIRKQEGETLFRLTLEANRADRLEPLRRFLSPAVAEMITSNGHPGLLKPHRAEVSILFVDLRRFTAFSERGQPEEVMKVLNDYYTAVGGAAMRHGGTLGHLAGDGIMIFFNDPEPIADHPAVCVRMAVEARDILRKLRDGWNDRGFDIDFGMGIASGYATLGEIGFENFSTYSVIGPVTNFASRLCHVAKGDQILVSHRFLCRLPNSGVQAHAVGEVELKGIDYPVQAFDIKAAA